MILIIFIDSLPGAAERAAGGTRVGRALSSLPSPETGLQTASGTVVQSGGVESDLGAGTSVRR